eukprot:m.36028 g.36028  ORF g.36028 m.36028 type:complete len:815 (+) comp14440_c0_seq1:194-2638(+)
MSTPPDFPAIQMVSAFDSHTSQNVASSHQFPERLSESQHVSANSSPAPREVTPGTTSAAPVAVEETPRAVSQSIHSGVSASLQSISTGFEPMEQPRRRGRPKGSKNKRSRAILDASLGGHHEPSTAGGSGSNAEGGAELMFSQVHAAAAGTLSAVTSRRRAPNTISVGDLFPSRTALRLCISELNMAQKRRTKVLRSDKYGTSFVCRLQPETCTFHVTAKIRTMSGLPTGDSECWEVIQRSNCTCCTTHSCEPSDAALEALDRSACFNPKDLSVAIGKGRSTPGVASVAAVGQDINKFLAQKNIPNLSASAKSRLRSRVLKLRKLDYGSDIRNLSGWIARLNEDSDSLGRIETHDGTVYTRSGFSPGNWIRAARACPRVYLAEIADCIPASNGCFYTVLAVDANYDAVPVYFGHDRRGESAEGWAWHLAMATEALPSINSPGSMVWCGPMAQKTAPRVLQQARIVCAVWQLIAFLKAYHKAHAADEEQLCTMAYLARSDMLEGLAHGLSPRCRQALVGDLAYSNWATCLQPSPLAGGKLHVTARAFWHSLDAAADGVRTLPITACYRRVVDVVGRQVHERRAAAQALVTSKGPRAATPVFQTWWDDANTAPSARESPLLLDVREGCATYSVNSADSRETFHVKVYDAAADTAADHSTTAPDSNAFFARDHCSCNDCGAGFNAVRPCKAVLDVYQAIPREYCPPVAHQAATWLNVYQASLPLCVPANFSGQASDLHWPPQRKRGHGAEESDLLESYTWDEVLASGQRNLPYCRFCKHYGQATATCQCADAKAQRESVRPRKRRSLTEDAPAPIAE